jgi:galactokinase
VLTQLEYVRARHAITEMERVLKAVIALQSGDFTYFGNLLHESHRSLRDDYTVSCPELNVAVEAAMDAGALGARMVGGGFGGSAIALVRKGDVAKTKNTIQASIALRGFKEPRFFTSQPSAGAGISPF